MTTRTRNTKKTLSRSISMPTLNEETDTSNATNTPNTSSTAPEDTPFATPSPSVSELNQVKAMESAETEFPTEHEIKDLGWKFYNSKEQELRSILHIEYLNTYISESLTPKGLQIRLLPSIKDDILERKWEQVLHTASQDLVKLLIEHHSRKLQAIEKERNVLNKKLNRIWDNEDKQVFEKDIEDSLIPREEELRCMKDKKLERDRRFSKKNSPANLQATSKPKVKYSDIIKKHIRNQIRQTSQNKSPESDNQARNIHHDPPLRRKQHF